MRNAKEEFLQETENKTVLCAIIQKGGEDYYTKTNVGVLRVGFSESELEAFLSALNFEYDDGYGGQELFGNIWYSDGTWSARGVHDGAEWWEYKKVPEIPKECAAKTVE